jgi:salicylate hydroxylase
MQVAIVGGGIAGVAAALALARRGFEAQVFEQSARIEELGAGLQLGPNAVRALQSLGAWERVSPFTVAPRALTVRNGETGAVLSSSDVAEIFERRFGAPYRVAHRGDLLRALVETAKATPGITFSPGCRVDFAESMPDGRMRLTVAARGTMEPQAVIGADGVRSVIRQAVIGDGPPRRSGYVYFRALLPAGKAPAGVSREDVTVWLLAGVHAVHYPVSAGRQINVVAVAKRDWAGEGWSAMASHEEVAAAFASACPPLAELLAAPANWLKWAGTVRDPAGGWSKGLATLIGDAAHPVPPFLAQGAAMALEDAAVLARHVAPGGDMAAAFRAYEADRFARTARMAREAVRQGQIYHMDGMMRRLRDLAIRLAPGEATAGRLSWLYAWMPP